MTEFADKVRGLGFTRGRPPVREGRDELGRFKATTDETGSTRIERAGDRVDLHLVLPSGQATTTRRGTTPKG